MQIEVGQQEKKGRECEEHSTQRKMRQRSTESETPEKSIHIVVEYTSRTLADLAITVVMKTSDTVIGKPDAGTPSLYIGYIPRLQHYVSLRPVPHPAMRANNVEREQYYVVDYTDRFYIGRVVRPQSSLRDFSTVKFLHQRMDNCVLLGPRRMI